MPVDTVIGTDTGAMGIDATGTIGIEAGAMGIICGVCC